MNSSILWLLVLFIGISACSKNDDNDNASDCELTTLISSEAYENAPSHLLTINSLELNHCALKVHRFKLKNEILFNQ